MKKRFFPIAFIAAWLLGYAPILNTWHKAGPLDVYFRLLILPPMIGLAAWGALTGGTLAAARFLHIPPDMVGIAKNQALAWFAVLPKRWPVLLLALLLGLGVWQQYNSFQDMTRQLVDYCSALRLSGSSGFLSTRHPHSNWCSPALESGIAPKIDFSSERDAEFRSLNFNQRCLGMFFLKNKERLKFELSSDDGSLLLVDGIRRLNLLGEHPVLKGSTEIKLHQGWHVLELLYFQSQGGAHLKLNLPDAVERTLHPLSAKVDFRRLWGFNRKIEVRNNRFLVLAWAAGLLFSLILLPYPRGWEYWPFTWLRSNWSLLAAVALAAVLMGLRLGLYPGLHGDEGLVGDAAFSQHWYGITHRNLSNWAWSDLTAKLTLYAQMVMPLGVAAIRIFPVVLNVLGVFLCGLAFKRLLGRRAGLFAVLLLGTAPWLLGMGRIGFELTLSCMFVLGGGLLGLTLCSRTSWGGVLTGVMLGLGAIVHLWWLHAILGFFAASLLMLRQRLFKSKAFWLGLAAFCMVAYPNCLQLIIGGQYNPTGAVDPARALTIVATSLMRALPWILDGSLVMKLHNTALSVPMFHLITITIAGMLLYWPFAGLGSRHNRILIWLALTVSASLYTLAFMVPYIRPHYFIALCALIILWAAVYLDGLWKRGARNASMIVLALLTLYGGGMFLVNGPLNLNPKITAAYQEKDPHPTHKVWANSQHFLPKRNLYQALLDKGYKICIPNMKILASLWFFERSDVVGRRGFLISRENKGSILVYFSEPDLLWRGRGAAIRNILEAKIPEILQPINLPSGLADKYKAYVIKKDPHL